jgi:hypothetical protein
MLAYNESAQAFFKWDPAKGEYPNLVLFAIWEQRSEDQSASDEYGIRLLPGILFLPFIEAIRDDKTRSRLEGGAERGQAGDGFGSSIISLLAAGLEQQEW